MTASSPSEHASLGWLGREAPRYTSYPSAHLFSTDVAEPTHRAWLSAIEEESAVSVYVHIPFCKELCWFCGCHTKMTKRYEPIARYVRVVLAEIELLKQKINGKGTLVNIHFGGGSPSLLEPGDLLSLLYAIRSMFGHSALEELAIELDPRTTTPENIAHYATVGVNRVSIGIQDFDPVVQQAINRVQSFPMVASVVEGLRAAGLHHINCDLIYGLPHQTAERFHDTLEKTLRLAPSRIALFSYAHVPQAKKHQRLILEEWLPSEPDKLILYRMAHEMLEAAGYIAVGMDHFARADDPMAIAMQNKTLRRNFQGYVTDATQALIGLGSSAISQFPQGYVQNNASTVEYRNRVESGHLPSVRGWAFRQDDRARKQLVDDLMCFMEVDLAAICAAFQLPADYFQAECEALTHAPYRGIVAQHGSVLRLNTPYRMAVRAVASVFDRYHGQAVGRYSKVA